MLMVKVPNTSKLKTIDDVAESLEYLGRQLEPSALKKLAIFNNAYLIITRNVAAKAREGYFENPDALTAIDIHFVGMYYDALRQYLGGGKCVPAWQVLFDSCKKGNSKRLCYLALGVNAHVINDLGQSVYIKSNNIDFQSDYQKVNAIIAASLDEIIKDCEVGMGVLNSQLKWGMVQAIRLWRNSAWNNSTALMGESITVPQIERKAVRQAKYLTLAPWPV